MTNRQWFDTYARHMVDTELYATARAELTLSMLEKLHKELKQIVESYGTIRSKKEEQKCADECNECIERYISEWKDKEDNERREHANNEAEWLSRMIKAALGISLINSLLKTNRALETPFSSSDTFDSFVDEMKADVQKAVRTPLLSSRIFGSSTSSVSESLDSAFKRIENNAKANMQSSVTGLQRNVQYQLIGDNRKLKFVYVSMLDDSTCVVCGGYSGTIYEDISEAPAVPVHIRCRCFYMPVLSSDDDISDITGETYETWFKRQPDSVKYRILGQTRYGLYKGGVTDIKGFSSGGRKLTLNELFSNLNLKSVNTGAKSEIVNKLSKAGIEERDFIAERYYKIIRENDNKDLITRISNNTGRDYGDIEQIINHIFINEHNFENGRKARFDASAEIVEVIERLKTGEFTDSDMLLLDHEFLELTLMKNKKYNIYEIAHNLANEVYNWQEEIGK